MSEQFERLLQMPKGECNMELQKLSRDELDLLFIEALYNMDFEDIKDLHRRFITE